MSGHTWGVEEYFSHKAYHTSKIKFIAKANFLNQFLSER